MSHDRILDKIEATRRGVLTPSAGYQRLPGVAACPTEVGFPSSVTISDCRHWFDHGPDPGVLEGPRCRGRGEGWAVELIECDVWNQSLNRCWERRQQKMHAVECQRRRSAIGVATCARRRKPHVVRACSAEAAILRSASSWRTAPISPQPAALVGAWAPYSPGATTKARSAR